MGDGRGGDGMGGDGANGKTMLDLQYCRTAARMLHESSLEHVAGPNHHWSSRLHSQITETLIKGTRTNTKYTFIHASRPLRSYC